MHVGDQLGQRNGPLAPLLIGPSHGGGGGGGGRRRPQPGQGLQHLLLAARLGLQLRRHLERQVRDDDAVGRVPQLAVVRLDGAQRGHPHAQVLHARRAVPEHIVARAHGVVLLHHEAHVVVRVARRVHRPHRRALHPEDLPVRDGLLRLARLVLVDGVLEVRVQAHQVGHAARVVAVPVREEHLGDFDVGLVARFRYDFGPFWLPLCCVDDDPLMASSHNVRVCAL